MPRITAVLHTHNDGLRLGRALESLRPCDEVLVIDDSSDDETPRIAHEYGATIKNAIPGVNAGTYVMDATNDWIFCLRPNESLSDDLGAALLEWKEQEVEDGIACYSVPVRNSHGNGSVEVRLVNRKQINWIGEMPPNQACSTKLRGDLLSFGEP